jgi:hypothetical protein
MTFSIPPVYFYAPSPDAVENVPETIDEFWPWGANVHFSHRWTVQTFLYLKACGFPCCLTTSLPDEGIIIAHSDMLPLYLKPSAKQFIVEIKPDRFLSCIFANFVIVQSRHDPILTGVKRLLISSAVVNYWPQPGLIPRDPKRGDRFESICFFGYPESFLTNANDLASQIEKLGLKWQMVPIEKWHDYSEVDAVVAVRQLDHPIRVDLSPNRKPASKLCNAWLAGVPAILSPDIAFQDIRKSSLDYLEARNIPEILDSLRQLMRDPLLRRSMIENGRIRAKEFRVEKLVERWIEIIQKQVIPKYVLWTESHHRRSWSFLTRKLAYSIDPRLLECNPAGPIEKTPWARGAC